MQNSLFSITFFEFCILYRKILIYPPISLLLQVDHTWHQAIALQHTHSLGRHDSAGRAPVRDPRPRTSRDAAGDAD